MRKISVLCVFGLSFGVAHAADSREFDGKVVLFGNLHAHSRLSGDFPSHAGTRTLPKHAFKHAREHGLDFLAISDHHKATDSPHRLSLTANEYRTKLFEVAMSVNREHAGEFVAIPAIEWGNTATGNHINLFGMEALPPEKRGAKRVERGGRKPPRCVSCSRRRSLPTPTGAHRWRRGVDTQPSPSATAP